MENYRLEVRSKFNNSRVHLLDSSGESKASVSVGNGKINSSSEEYRLVLSKLVRERFSGLLGSDAVETASDETSPIEAARRIPGNSIDGMSKFDPESLHKGIVAEQRTAGILSTIMNGSDGKALHSIIVDGRRDIDHVFFCDRGVFAINTKYRRLTHDIEGKFRGDWAQKVLDDARVVAQTSAFDHSGMLDTDSLFHPVIALWSEPTSLVPSYKHERASLVPGELIADFILAGPAVMSVDAASAMFETLRLRINKTLAGATK